MAPQFRVDPSGNPPDNPPGMPDDPDPREPAGGSSRAPAPEPEPGRTPDPAPGPGNGIWSTWSNFRLLLLAFALLALDLILQQLVIPLTEDMFLPVAAGALLGVLLPCWAVARTAGGSLASEFHLGRAAPRQLGWAMVAAIAAVVPTSVLSDLSARLSPMPQDVASFIDEHIPQTPWSIVAGAVAAVVLAPAAEELLFRGILYRMTRRLWGVSAAAVVTALAFALVHGSPWYFFGLLVLGFLFAYIYEMTGSLTPGFLAHGLYNGISYTLLIKMKDLDALTARADATDILILIGSSALLGLACVRLARQDS